MEFILGIIEIFILDKDKFEKYSDKKIVVTLSFLAFLIFNVIGLYIMFNTSTLYGALNLLGIILFIFSINKGLLNHIFFIGYLIVNLFLIFMNINIVYPIIFMFAILIFNIISRKILIKI